jgi:hypothetical protein
MTRRRANFGVGHVTQCVAPLDRALTQNRDRGGTVTVRATVVAVVAGLAVALWAIRERSGVRHHAEVILVFARLAMRSGAL